MSNGEQVILTAVQILRACVLFIPALALPGKITLFVCAQRDFLPSYHRVNSNNLVVGT